MAIRSYKAKDMLSVSAHSGGRKGESESESDAFLLLFFKKGGKGGAGKVSRFVVHDPPSLRSSVGHIAWRVSRHPTSPHQAHFSPDHCDRAVDLGSGGVVGRSPRDRP